MLLAAIFPAKQTQQKGMESSTKKKHELITFVFLAICEPIISYNFFLWQALKCSEILSPIIRTHKNPLGTHIFFLLGSIKKIAKFYGDVTLVTITKNSSTFHFAMSVIYIL